MTRLGSLYHALRLLGCTLRGHRLYEYSGGLRCSVCSPLRERKRVTNVDPRQRTIDEVQA